MGINDALALHAADMGISVDTALDIAKESGGLILLQKDLNVLEGRVIEGRKVFANILEHIRMGASSNFGNMCSALGASALLPFIPMAPIQIQINNMLYDISQIPIPADAVNDELVAKPRPWNIAEIRRFILFVGPIISIFDYTIFFVMLHIFKCWHPSNSSVVLDGVVCQVADDADADHPCYPHQQNPVPAKPGKLVANADDGGHHGLRRVASILSAGHFAGSGPPAGAIVADPDANSA